MSDSTNSPLAGPDSNHKYEVSVDRTDDESVESDGDSHVDDGQKASLVTHQLSIRHHKPGSNDDEYTFYIRGGEIRGIERHHQMAPTNQFDPDGYCSLTDLPSPVRLETARQLNVDSLDAIANHERIRRHADG